MAIPDKKTRSVRLTLEVDARLRAICDHLGTNPNAYLINKIGEAISASEQKYFSKANEQGMFELGRSFERQNFEDGSFMPAPDPDPETFK